MILPGVVAQMMTVASGGGGPNPGDGTVDPGGIVADFEWWASDLTSLSDGDTVGGSGAEWIKHAGAAVSANLVSASGAPKLRLDASGVRVVRFVPSNSDGLAMSTATGNGERSIYALIKLASGAVGTIVGSDTFQAGHLQFRANGPFSGGVARLSLMRQQQTQIVLGASTIGTGWRLVEAHTDGSTAHEVVLDGVVDGSSSSSAVFTSSNRVGRMNGGEYLDGDIAALIINNTVHDSTQKAAMRTRLHTAFSLLIGP